VLDLSMPGITGVELQRRLASSGNSLPVLFLTGDDDIPDKVRATIMEGAVDILTKPVDGSALFKGVNEALARDREARKSL
jgi:FixJ family two-component response regulator